MKKWKNKGYLGVQVGVQVARSSIMHVGIPPVVSVCPSRRLPLLSLSPFVPLSIPPNEPVSAHHPDLTMRVLDPQSEGSFPRHVLRYVSASWY